jgi:hypothetical protein
MNSTAFSLLANSSAGTNGNQETELTIRSLSILIGSLGSTRLTDPVTSQDFDKFWGGNFFASVLLEMIEISQGFKTF